MNSVIVGFMYVVFSVSLFTLIMYDLIINSTHNSSDERWISLRDTRVTIGMCILNDDRYSYMPELLDGKHR
jgi:hypothetical protein